MTIPIHVLRCIQTFEGYVTLLQIAVDEYENAKSDLILDAVIYRFRITFETAWKAISEFVKFAYGTDANSPKMTIMAASHFSLINDVSSWNGMLTDRNSTSHPCNAHERDKLYNRIVDTHIPNFKNLLHRLEENLL